MVSEEHPGLMYGGSYSNGTGAGVFDFYAWGLGNAGSHGSFRLVLNSSL